MAGHASLQSADKSVAHNQVATRTAQQGSMGNVAQPTANKICNHQTTQHLRPVGGREYRGGRGSVPSDKAQCGEAAKFQFLPNSFAVAHFPFVSINKAGRGRSKEGGEGESSRRNKRERGAESRKERKRGRAAASKAHIRHEILN